MFFALLNKDLRNLRRAIGPALLLGLPLILLLGIFNESLASQNISWWTAMWLSFFVSSSALFYRSFGQEHESRNFAVYTGFGVPKLQVLWSQCLVHMLGCISIGIFYAFLAMIFWSPLTWPFAEISLHLFLISLAIAPIGSLMGLMLQVEREFLFSIVFFPLSTPVILAAFELSTHQAESWYWILGIFIALSGFLSSLFFEFYFDEVS